MWDSELMFRRRISKFRNGVFIISPGPVISESQKYLMSSGQSAMMVTSPTGTGIFIICRLEQ